MKYKVILCGLNCRYSHTNLALRSLRRYALERGLAADLMIVEETIQTPSLALLHRILQEKPQVVAFSCYLWNIELVRRLSRDLRQIDPELVIVWGGPELSDPDASWLSDEPAVDYLIRGEGEATFHALLQRLLQEENPRRADEKALSRIAGLSHQSKEEGPQRVALPETLLAPDAWPFPYDDEELELSKGRMFYYEASRGCPYACAYCLSARDVHLRQRPLPLVFSELERFLAAGVRQVKFVDRTFNCDATRALSIWQHLIEADRQQPSGTNFHFEIAGDRLNEAAIRLLQTAPPGLLQLEIGVQTIQPHVLAAINRQQDFERLACSVRRLTAKGNVHVHLDLIAGLPGETLGQFAESFDAVFALRAPHLQLGFLKVLPGTPMQSIARDRDYRWQAAPPYEVLASDALSFAELGTLRKISEVLERFHNNGLLQGPIRYLAQGCKGAFSFFSEFVTFLHEREDFRRSLSPADRARALWLYALEKDARVQQDLAQRQAFRDLLRHAFVLGGHKGQPEFLDFWESRPDFPARQQLLQRRARLQKDRDAPRRFRVDRLSFDPHVFEKKGRLVPDEALIVYDFEQTPPAWN